MYDGSVHARRGTIAGWHLTPDYIQNFAPGTSPSRATKLYSGSPDETEGKNIYSIETDSINIKGENSKLTIGNFLFTSNMLRVGKESPYQLVIDKNGNFGVGSVTLTSDNIISTANFKVDKDGNTTIGGVTDGVATFKIDQNGNLTIKNAFKVDNSGNMGIGSVSTSSDGKMSANLKIDNTGNLFIAQTGEKSYKVKIGNDGTLALGSAGDDYPYFKVSAKDKTVSIGHKEKSTEYYITINPNGVFKCGGCTIKDVTSNYSGDDGSSTVTGTRIFFGEEGTGAYWGTSGTSTYFYSPGQLMISSKEGAVYLGGLTFSVVDYKGYTITAAQGRVLAKVV